MFLEYKIIKATPMTNRGFSGRNQRIGIIGDFKLTTKLD